MRKFVAIARWLRATLYSYEFIQVMSEMANTKKKIKCVRRLTNYIVLILILKFSIRA